MTRVDLPLHCLLVDRGTQVRATIDDVVVTHYAERMIAGDLFPAVLAYHDGSYYFLADGFHRCLAARRLGRTTFPADVYPGGRQQALWCALGANRVNGKQMTAEDKQHAIELALREWGKGGRTQSEIAAQIGIASSTLSYHAARLVDTGRLERPTTVVSRDGHTVPIPPRAAAGTDDRRTEIATRLQRGEDASVIAKDVHIHRDKVFTIKRELGLSPFPDRSRDATQKRYAQMRAMAVAQHTSIQIAAAVGMSIDGCRLTLRRLGIAVPADKAMRGIKRHDSNRIVDTIVMDAANLTEGVALIDFTNLDREQIPEWLRSLQVSRDKLGMFIRRLMKEQQHGDEAAHSEAVQDSTGPDRTDARAASPGSAA